MQVFQNSEFGELGVLEVNGKPYFSATACAKMLGFILSTRPVSLSTTVVIAEAT